MKNNKLYFIRPKSEFNFDGMMTYLVIAKDEDSAWKLLYQNALAQPHSPSPEFDSRTIDEFSDYFASNIFELVGDYPEQIIWDETKIGKGI